MSALNLNLRDALEEITNQDLLDRHKFVRELDGLRTKFRHSITVEDVQDELLDRSNCHAFSLGIYRTDEYLSMADIRGYAFVKAAHMVELIRRKLLERRRPNSVSPGDLIFYYDKGKLTHSAVAISPERVRSKWGSQCVLTHGIFEVPISYGDDLETFAAPEIADILHALHLD